MEIKLTTWERIRCAVIVAEARGGRKLVSRLAALRQLLVLKPDEQESIEWKETNGQASWKNEAYLWSLEIPDYLFQVLVEQVDKYEGFISGELELLKQLCVTLGIDTSRDET